MEVPSCVAALAAARIAELASLETFEDAESTAVLLQKGGIELLLENLSSPLNDVRENSAVAIDYLLTSRSPLRCKVLSSEAALDILQKHLTEQKEGMRFTVSCILHSFYSQHKDNGEHASKLVVSFKQGELLKALIKIISNFQRLSLLNQHLQHLIDLIRDRNTAQPHPDRVKAVTEAGLLEILNEVEYKVKLMIKDRRLVASELNLSQYTFETISRVRSALSQ